MSILTILDSIFLKPVISLIEILFYFVNFVSHNTILTIIIVAIFVNFMFMPISKHASTFNEKVYANKFNIKCNKLLKKYQKINNKNNLSYMYLNLLKIVFFMAVYDFFSKLALFEEVYSGFLLKPDSIMKLAKLEINILPILMISLNLIYFLLTQKSTTQNAKIELYSVTMLLFILLYNAPAGVIIFWITTNAFYLLKFLLSKHKHFKNLFKYILSVLGFSLIFSYIKNKHLLLLIVGGLLQLPIIYYLIRFKIINRLIKPKKLVKRKIYKTSKKQFFITSTLIILLIGVLIPSTYIAASPQEYINSSLFFNPLNYIVNAFFIAVGYILIWFGTMFIYSTKKNKYRINKLLTISVAIMIVDYMFFGLNLGTLSFTLQYDFGFYFTIFEAIINVLVIIAIIILFSFTYKKIKDYIAIILSLVILVFSTMSTFNIVNSVASINDYKNGVYEKSKMSYNLSTTGHNVVVIMLDRAMGQFLPFLFNEKPELQEQFDGFTYYQNTISYGYFTNIATPALLGGYEYTPVEINKRDSESLKNKHNEAHLVMPQIFANAGYNVSVIDPIYVDYKYNSNLSMFNNHENINAFYSIGRFIDDDHIKYTYNQNMTNFFRFSFMKTLPFPLQYIFYDEGNFNNMQTTNQIHGYGNQKTISVSKSSGIRRSFMDNYLTLKNMRTMTSISSDETNTFLFLRNDITHEETLLDAENNYTPNFEIDNTEYDFTHQNRFTLSNGQKLNITNTYQMTHYHINMAAIIQVGNWLDYLKENNVYDNTRIIIVSDHGRNLYSIDGLTFEDETLEMCTPLLMVKDFNSTGFNTSQNFMTNADVATLATQNLGFEAKNPFSGNQINMDAKFAHKQYISTSYDWDVGYNNGNTFKASKWLCFDSTAPNCNIYNLDNWSLLKQNVVLKSHSFN